MSLRGLLLTTVAMVAFAANSVLCRAALVEGAIDASSFTALRLASGALILIPWLRRPQQVVRAPSARSAVALFAYAALFSFAYTQVTTGTGALLAFGAVQLSMVALGMASGERPTALGVGGLVVASSGLVLLTLPGVQAPPLLGALAMLGAGTAWGVYSHLGRGQPGPSFVTAVNFRRAAVAGLLLFAASHTSTGSTLTPTGVALAVSSGALTSGLGYVVWYAALKDHTATSAAAVQLSAPLLAAAAGVVLLGEPASARLLAGGGLILGGIALSLMRRPALRPSTA